MSSIFVIIGPSVAVQMVVPLFSFLKSIIVFEYILLNLNISS